jgi:O-glycosyl hydrolase
MRRPLLMMSLLLLPIAFGGAECDWPYEPHAAVPVTLDLDALHQRIDGFGGSAADESALRAMPEPDRSEVLDLVFGDLAPSVVRIKPRPAMEPVNDDADPAHVNAAGFVRPEDHLWQLAEIFARGNAPKLIGALWTPPAWMKTTGQECCGGTLLPGMDAELAEFFSVYLSYLEEAGHPLDSLSIQNEPEAASPWDANTYAPPRMANVLEAVAQRIVADGHATRLHGPDDAVASFVPVYLPALLAKPTAASLFDAVGFHLYGSTWYPDSSTVAPDVTPVVNAAPEGMPLWMTEFSNTTFEGYGSFDEGIWQAELIHESLVAGVSMYVMWNLYRPGGPGEAAIVIPTTSGAHGYTVTPKYWTLRQYAKYVRPGAVRVEATSGDPDLLVTAFRDDEAGKLIAVAINRADEARWAVFDGANLVGAPQVVRTSPLENGVEVPLDSADRFADRSLLLPARSVATLIWPLPE